MALCAALCGGICCRPGPADAPAAAECAGDLRTAFGLLERNYSGYGDKLRRLGQPALEAAQRTALEGTQRADGDCLELLWRWLAVFQDHHLGVTAAGVQQPPAARRPAAGATDPALPSFELRSARAALIRAPSFFLEYRPALETLVREHRGEIVARPNLIIDVRGNAGGADSSYKPLAELVYAGPVAQPGLDALATPENVSVLESLLPGLPDDVQAQVRAMAAQMRSHSGEFVKVVEDGVTQYPKVLPLPSRVAILVDRGCGSACEQFLLEARASAKVMLFGAPSDGALDYSNLVPHRLPSGRSLWLPITRSRRLPEHPIDGNGVTPDVPLAPELFGGPQRERALDWVVSVLENPALAGTPPRWEP